jgi:hypothetical protein
MMVGCSHKRRLTYSHHPGIEDVAFADLCQPKAHLEYSFADLWARHVPNIDLIHQFKLPMRRPGITCGPYPSLDFAHPSARLGIEIQGATWHKGSRSHGGGVGGAKDAVKVQMLAPYGWIVIPVTAEQLDNEAVVLQLAATIRGRTNHYRYPFPDCDWNTKLAA